MRDCCLNCIHHKYYRSGGDLWCNYWDSTIYNPEHLLCEYWGSIEEGKPTMPNQTMKVLLTPKYIKVYFDNLNTEQHKLLDSTLAKALGHITLEPDGYIITATPENLYKTIYTLCNSFSIELI